MATRQSLNPALMIVLIALVIGTVTFTGLIIVKSNHLRSALEGNPEHRFYKEPITKIEREIRDLKASVAATETTLAARDRERWRLDVQLTEHDVRFFGNTLRYGAMGEEIALADNQKFTSAEHEAREARAHISRHLERMRKRREQAESADRQTFPPLEQAIADRQTEQQNVMRKAQEAEQIFTGDIEGLGSQQEDLNTKRDQAQRQKRDDFSRNATKIGQLEDRIRDLLELELRWMTEVDADGSVLELGIEHGFVIIDIGKADKVFPGLILAAFQHEKGQYKEKGMVEVIDVDAHIATCRVVAEYDGRHYPIAKGDKVGNPVFDSARPKVFVLAGEFLNYNKADLEDFIVRTGGLVREKLSPGVDFLIAGERSDKQQDNAREYQVLAMKEEQLLRFLQTTFAAKVAGNK